MYLIENFSYRIQVKFIFPNNQCALHCIAFQIVKELYSEQKNQETWLTKFTVTSTFILLIIYTLSFWHYCNRNRGICYHNSKMISCSHLHIKFPNGNSQKENGTFQASGTSLTLYESRVISVSNNPENSAYKMMKSKINNHSNPIIKIMKQFRRTIEKNQLKIENSIIHTSICFCTTLGLFFHWQF